MHARILSFVLLSVLTALGTATAHAQGLVDRRPRGEYRGEPAGMSQDEAVKRAESRYNAKAVKVDRVMEGDRVVYQIRLLNAESKVFTVRVDAATGRMN